MTKKLYTWYVDILELSCAKRYRTLILTNEFNYCSETSSRECIDVRALGSWYVLSFSVRMTCFHLGKTSIVYVMKHGKMMEAAFPTIGVDFEHLIIGTTILRAWEAGGRERYRPLNAPYYRNTKAFVFVVDSNDRHGINLAYTELRQMRIEERFKDKPVLILANKQDLPDAMSVDELKNKLGLNEFDEKIVWHLQAASALQNQGIKEGFEWLASKFVITTDVMKPIEETVNDTVAIKNYILSLFNFNSWKKMFNKFFDS